MNIGSSLIEKWRNSIQIGDCIELMKMLPENSIDLIIADPPYNLSKGGEWKWDQSEILPGMGGKWEKVKAEWDSMPMKDYFEFSLNWLALADRALKPTGTIWVFGTYHNIGIINVAFQALDIEIINEIIWYKRNAFPNLSGRRITASHETLLWGHSGHGKRDYYFDYDESKIMECPEDPDKKPGKQMRTVWNIPNNKTKVERQFGKHPTQKPLVIMDRIVRITSKPGDLILAPFSGAGTECIAALQNNRNYLGFENNESYVEISQKRIAHAMQNQQKSLEEFV